MLLTHYLHVHGTAFMYYEARGKRFMSHYFYRPVIRLHSAQSSQLTAHFSTKTIATAKKINTFLVSSCSFGLLYYLLLQKQLLTALLRQLFCRMFLIFPQVNTHEQNSLPNSELFPPCTYIEWHSSFQIRSFITENDA